MANNNVVSFQEVGIPAAPDLAALQAMQAPVVIVHKIIPRGGTKRDMQLVINGAKKLKAPQILELQDLILDTNRYALGGPGYYRFEVTDGSSTAKQVWETRLGGAEPEGDGPLITASPVQPAGLPAAAAGRPDLNIPPSPDTVSLGNGFIYNARFKLLTMPDGRILQWDSSQPLPDLTPSFARGSAGPATPLGAAMFGSAASPQPNTSSETETLRAELARMKDEQREQTRQRELADMRTAHQKEIEAISTRMEALIEKIAAKPVDDPRLVELQRQLEEQKRQDTLRAEFTAKIDSITALIRESQANRSDPMVSTLTQLMTQQQSAARDNLQIMRDSLNTQLGSAQATALTPEKLLSILDRAKDSGSNIINEKLVGIFSGMLDTMLRFRQAESAMSGGGSPNWMDILERLAERASGAIQAMGQAKARQATAETAKANVEAVRLQTQREQAARAAAARKLPPAPPAQTPPQPALTGEAARDAFAAQVFKPTPAATTPPVAPSPEPAANVVPLRPVEAPQTTPAAAAPPPPARPDLPVQIDKRNPLAKMTVSQLHDLYDKVPDENFFGPFFEIVTQLREALQTDPNSVSADEVAGYVMEARPQIAQAAKESGQVPIVIMMLAYGQFAYMFERMAPEMDATYWNEAATALRAKVVAERANAG